MKTAQMILLHFLNIEKVTEKLNALKTNLQIQLLKNNSTIHDTN